jgi:hypothetical protein
MIYTLSGGQFGGQEVSVIAGQSIIDVVDDNGAIWQYEIRQELENQAIFIGIK